MGFLRQLVGAVLQVVGVATGNFWLYAAGASLTIYDAKREQAKQRRAAIQRYNDSLVDRLQMVDVLPDAARSIVLGRVRSVEGIRRRWVSGGNSEKLTLVVSFAGHEIDAFEGFYADDTLLTIDVDGYVQTEPYVKLSKAKTARQKFTLDGSGNGSVSLTETPIAGSMAAIYSSGSGDNYIEGALAVSDDGSTATITGGPPSSSGTLFYRYQTGTPLIRLRAWTGAIDQNVGAAIAADYPGKITSSDRFAGIALAVIDITYDPDVFPQGYPNFTALMRGAKVYDPRLDTTAGGSGPQRDDDATTWTWSDNAALCTYHYARHANGMDLPIGVVRVSDVIAAADVSDVSTAFTLRMPDESTTTYTSARYRCGTVIPTDASPAEVWDDLIRSMAGKWGWAGGNLRLRAGVLATTSFELDASWVASIDGDSASGEPVVRISNGTPREDRINKVTGSCMNPDERYQVLPYASIQDDTLIAQDGAVYPVEVPMPSVPHPALAQHIASMLIRASQASLRMQVNCNMSAFRVELLDVGEVTLDRFGFAAKTFEVDGWQWAPTSGIQLQMSEITAAMFTPLSELTGADPAPNTTLRDPRVVDQVEGVAVESATDELKDGSVLTRTRVSWTPVTQQSVVRGGSIEVQYVEAVNGDPTNDGWPSWVEDGAASDAIIPGLLTGRHYFFRVRAIQPFPLVKGPWSSSVLHQIALPPEAGGSTFVVEFSDATGVFYSNAA